MTKKDDLVQYLNKEIIKAKKFTDKFITRNKRDVQLYEAKHISTPESLVDSGGDVVSIFNAQAENRYRQADRMIFTNTEGAKATMFDRVPDLIFKSRNQEGDIKKQLIEGIYEYFKDKLSLRAFANKSLHWFVLSGFSTVFVDYLVKSHEAPQYDENGEEVYDEFGNQAVFTKYDYDDPIIFVGDPQKVYFSPASKFNVGLNEAPLVVREEKINVETIKDTYDVSVKPDSTEDEDDKSSNMATVYFCYGTIPEKEKHLVSDWEYGAEYYIITTKKKVLHQVRRKRKQVKAGKWYSQPNQFFGFGFGVIGEPYQIAKELRKSQISRAADVSAFAKMAIKNDGDEVTNPEDWKDPRENLAILYTSQKPEYLQPPGIGDTVLKDLEQTESDAQAAFGLLDISSGAQESSTVQTATGQTIFAEAAQKRLKFGKRLYMELYREVVIELFKQAQENWTEAKPITISNDDGETEIIQVTKEDLADIDFDKDLDIDYDSITVNKDIIREQMIALYDKVKDDPLVDRKKVFADMMRKGFGVTNPERYIKEASGVEPGTPLVNPETGEQFIVGESGEVMSQQTQDEMAQPGGEQVAQSQGAVLNAGR